MASMIYKMTNRAKNGEPIELFKSNDPKYSDGGQMRDFIYVKDAVKMTSFFLENSHCGIFNIGSGVPTTWNQIAAALFSALEKKPNIKYIDMPEGLSSQYQNYTCADMSKFMKICSSFRFTGIEDAVKEYVRNYLIHNKTW
jgi:ADP-L-glycero-D-manno-heptose 6-epimerase